MEMTFVHVAETESTNRWLREHGGGEDMVVWADYQTAGRGCGHNRWESARGQNLLFSMLLHPEHLLAGRQFDLSVAISVALVDALSLHADGLSIKWPNDIYWRDRKLCGILIENRISGQHVVESIIGVGVNVNQTRFVGDAPNPVSLRQVTGRELSREALLRDIVGRFEPVADHDRYRRLLYRRHGLHGFTDATGHFEARLRDVEPDGRLVLEDRGGALRRYAFKEVSFDIDINDKNDI